MPRHIKLINENKVCKKLEYPKNYEQLLKYASDFVLINEKKQKLELREGTEGRKIQDEEDFNLMTKDLINQDCIKISVRIIDIIETNNNNLSENENNDKKLNFLKVEFKKKIDELVDEFFKAIDNNMINKKRKRENINDNLESEEKKEKK